MNFSRLTFNDLRVKESDTSIRISTPVEHLPYTPEIEGLVIHQNGELQFSKPLFNQHTAGLVALHLGGAMVQSSPTLTTTKLVAPTDADLETINESHSLRSLSADDVKVYQRWVINDVPARSGFIFTRAALKKFAQDFKQGRTVLLYHNQQRPVGRTFQASVTKDTIRGVEANWVKLKLYVPVRDEKGEQLDYTLVPTTMLDTGVLAYDSIGFGGGRMRGIRIGEGENERFYLEVDHDKNQQNELEAGELSFVFMGNIKGAGNNKQEAQLETEAGVIPDPDTGTQGDPVAESTNSQNSQTIFRSWL